MMLSFLKNLIYRLNKRRKSNIAFRKEFKEKTGVDLNDIDISGGQP